MDRLGLFSRFIHREHQATVHQLFIDVDGGGGQEQHHRAFDPVLFGHQVAGGLVLAGAGDGQLAFRLQQLQGIRRILRAFLFRDSQYLVFEVGLAHVEQALPGHGRVLHPLFFRHQVQHRIHQRGFTGGAGGLDDDGQRLVQLARDAGQIAGQFVGLFTHHAATVEVIEDALQQIVTLEQRQGLVPRHVIQGQGVVVDFQRFLDLHFLQGFAFEQHTAQVALD